MVTDRDGNPIQPLGWQGHGIDWELYRGKPHRAEGYDEDVHVATVKARTLIGLNRKMRRAERRFGLPRNAVLG